MSAKLKEKGNESFKKGEFKKAAKLYRDAIALDPYNPVLYSNRSICFIKLNDWKRVLDDSNTGIALCRERHSTKSYQEISADIINKTLVKLLYRKGLAVTNLATEDDISAIPQAIKAFNEGLETDPSNVLIKKELNSLNQRLKLVSAKINKGTKNKKSALQTINIEEVDRLPENFQALIDGKASAHSPMDIDNSEFKNDLKTEDNSYSNELLFESNKAKKSLIEENSSVPATASKVDDASEEAAKTVSESLPFTESEDVEMTVQFPEVPTHYFLTTITKYSGAQRIKAYKYIIDLPVQTYNSAFGIAGIETDFLEFFLEAAVYVLSNNQENETCSKKILQLLTVISEFKRFSLSRMFCDSIKIKAVISILKRNNINDDQTFKLWGY